MKQFLQYEYNGLIDKNHIRCYNIFRIEVLISGVFSVLCHEMPPTPSRRVDTWDVIVVHDDLPGQQRFRMGKRLRTQNRNQMKLTELQIPQLNFIGVE